MNFQMTGKIRVPNVLEVAYISRLQKSLSSCAYLRKFSGDSKKSLIFIEPCAQTRLCTKKFSDISCVARASSAAKHHDTSDKRILVSCSDIIPTSLHDPIAAGLTYSVQAFHSLLQIAA
jgi:hypothetical protein